jgi:hypothetical protein
LTFGVPSGVGMGQSTAKTFTLTPHAVGDFILLWVISETTADYASAVSSSNVNSGADWTVLVAHHTFTNNTVAQTVFIGQVTSTSGATVTVTTAGSPVIRVAWQEFTTTAGYASVTLDAPGTTDTATGGTMPPVTPTKLHDLYCGYVYDNGSALAGSTSGYTYTVDAEFNTFAYNTSCANSTQTPNIGDGNGTSGIGVMLYEAVTSFSGAAVLSGTGSLTAAGKVVAPGSAVLSGTGSLGAAPAVAIPSAVFLTGTGSLTASASVMTPGQVSVILSGTGTLGVAGTVGWAQAAVLSGTGTLAAQYTGIMLQSAVLSGTGTLAAQYTGIMLQSAVLAGTGTLTVASSAALKFTAGLFGAGFLSIPQVAGGLVNGTGGAATPQAMAGSSQVAVAPPGSSNWQWLGTLGQVTALTYSYICPGGCDQMTCTIMVPASLRTQLFNPGWQVKITRGGHQVWDGKMDEPVPTASGWTLTAVGTGNLGANVVDYYSIDDVFPAGEPDEIINRAIGRGLPWVNPGLNSSPYFSQFWMGQSTDPGSTTVTAFLNLICTRGGLVWYVNSQPGGVYNGDDLQVFPLPTVPNRLLVCTTPVARTLGGDINSVIIRFMSVADNSTATPPVAASYDVVNAINAQSVAAHGVLETYIDLSDVGQMSSSAAQAIGQSVLALYVRASFAGPFQASYGQLLNTGGQAIDPGTDQAGTMVRMILSDWGLGGEVQPGPIEWIVGAYEWDDFAQVATITPYQSLDQSLTGLLSMTNTVMTPITAAG